MLSLTKLNGAVDVVLVATTSHKNEPVAIRRPSPPLVNSSIHPTRPPDFFPSMNDENCDSDNHALESSLHPAKWPSRKNNVSVGRVEERARLSHSPLTEMIARFENRAATTNTDVNGRESLLQGGNVNSSLQRFWTAKSTAPTSHHLNSYPNDAVTYGRRPELCRAVLRTLSPASRIVHRNVSPPPPVRRAAYSCLPHDTSSSATISPSLYSSHCSADANISVGEEKTRYSSYLRFNFGGAKDDTGASSRRPPRHPSPGQPQSLSPEPPPRYTRLSQPVEDGTPLANRKTFVDSSHLPRLDTSPSPAFTRLAAPSLTSRVPECSSVPGSPQHYRVERFRARLHYTPEPQRRVYDSGPQQF